MKKLFKTLSVAMILAMLLTFVPESAAQAATTYKLSATKKTLYVGGCAGAKADGTKAPYKASYTIKVTGKKSTDVVSFASKNKKVATVTKKGKVTAVADGTTSINVKIKTKAGKVTTKVFKVTVKSNAASVSITGLPEDNTFTVSEDAYTLTAVQLNAKGTASKDLVLFSIPEEYKAIASISATGSLKVKSAGDFVIKVKTYMSAKYPAATASAEVNVKAVEGEKEKVPMTAKQLSETKVELKVDTELTSVSKADVKASYSENGSAALKVEDVREAVLDSKDKTKVIVTLWNKIKSGAEYVVTLGSGENQETAKFTGASLEAKDAKSIELVTKSVVKGKETKLEFVVYTKDGIEMGDDVKSNVNFEVSPSDGQYTKATNSLQLYDSKTVVITAVYSASYYADGKVQTNEFKQTFNIAGIEPEAASIAKVEYTFGAAGSAIFDSKTYVQSTSLAANDVELGRNTDLVFRLTYSDGTIKTNDGSGYDYESSDPNVVLAAGKTLKPIKAGSASIIVYEAGTKTIVKVFDITIKAERKPVSVVATASKTTLNTVAADIGEELIVSVTVYDNYNEVFPEASVTLSGKGFGGDAALDSSKVTETIANGVHKMRVAAGSAVTGEGTLTVTATASFNGVEVTSQSVAFSCKKVDTSSKVDRIVLEVQTADGSTEIDNCIASDKTFDDYKFTVYYSGYSNGYQVTKKTAAKPDNTASYIANSTDYYFQVANTSVVANESGYTNYVADGTIYTVASKAGEIKKLANGTYTVTLFKVITDASKNPTKTKEAITAITVKDTQPSVVATKIANTATTLTEASVLSDRLFLVTYGSTTLMSAEVAPAANLSFEVTIGSDAMVVRKVCYKVLLADGVNGITLSQGMSEVINKK